MILVAGLPRSGTTWMSRMLGKIIGGDFLFEPFAGIGISSADRWGDVKMEEYRRKQYSTYRASIKPA